MTALDEIADIVLGNIKLPSEKAEHIIPFLKQIERAFGKPIVVTSDMGTGIASAVEKVFPAIPRFICHYHFLRDIGKDLFGGDYEALRRIFKSHTVRTSLNKLARQLKNKIEKQPDLTHSLNSYLNNNHAVTPPEKPLPTVLAYTLALWILDAKGESKGHGFPFDRPYLSYYQRIEIVKDTLMTLTTSVAKQKDLVHLTEVPQQEPQK